MDLDEFYVASNPPLSPSGVEEVLDRLRLMKPGIKIHEVIYDPEVPWFRFLADGGVRHEVTTFVTGVLTEIGEQDASAAEKEKDHGSSSSNADVETGEESRLTPWSANMPVSDQFDLHRFPKFAFDNDTTEPPYKAVWRGLEENWPRFESVEQFFDSLKLPPLVGQPLTPLERIQEHFNVELSWNLKATLLYIASHKNMASVENCIKKLSLIMQGQKKNQTIQESRAKLVDIDGDDADEADEVVFW